MVDYLRIVMYSILIMKGFGPLKYFSSENQYIRPYMWVDGFGVSGHNVSEHNGFGASGTEAGTAISR